MNWVLYIDFNAALLRALFTTHDSETIQNPLQKTVNTCTNRVLKAWGPPTILCQ